MIDWIDRGAVLRLMRDAAHGISGERQCGCLYCEAMRGVSVEVRSLPAAVPVVDVEKACRELYLVANDGMRTAACCGDGLQFEADDARAILSAGYAGSVSVEDVRDVARFVDTIARCIDRGEKITFSDLGEIGPAAKRLLAALEVKP